MPLSAGARLGPYEIDTLLGVGGMGEVYRARDTRLDRIVAVKVLSPELAADPLFRERFDREARAISSLADPHICPLFDVGETVIGHQSSAVSPALGPEAPAPIRFLVMQYLEGDTLAKRLESGAVPLAQALAFAVEIAKALDAAHRQGVVHRDLKPGNVMVTKSGTKLLDFGLAKSASASASAAGATPRAMTAAMLATAAATTPPSLTAHGAILGTIQYMSPEQVQGADADARSDIFAFGALLYEMVTGQKAFSGKNQFTVIGAILDHEPVPASQVMTATPAGLDRVIRKCLAKDPEQRWQTARDLASELEWIAETTSRPVAEPSTAAAASQAAQPSRGRLLALGGAGLGVGAALAAVAAWVLLRPGPAPAPQPVRFTLAPTGSLPLAVGSPFRDIALSPDGSHLVYAIATGPGTGRLMVRALDQLEATPLVGIDGASAPFISPDGKWVGFMYATGSGSIAQLKKVSMTGGPPITICALGGILMGASWGPDDSIVFSTLSATGNRLMSVPAGGGEPKALTTPDVEHGEMGHAFPSVLPGGRAVLFTIAAGRGPETFQIAVLDRASGQHKILVRGGAHAEYVAASNAGDPGYLVYAVSGTLRAVRFDPARLEVVGDQVPIVDRVRTKNSGVAEYAVSRQGGLVYVPGGVQGSPIGAARSLVWVDRKGTEEPVKAPPRAYQYLNLSPDGTKMAVEIRDQDDDIWIWDFAHETLTRLTFDPVTDAYPVWTPDGRRVIFSSPRGGVAGLFWQPADGTGTPERLTTSSTRQVADSISPDGTQLVLMEDIRESRVSGDLKVLQLPKPSTTFEAGKLKAEPLIQTAFNERNGEVSPDGHWLAYESNESGDYQIYVRPFPNVNGGRWQVSSKGGTKPKWAPNGRELFYFADGYLTTVPVQTSAVFSSGNPTKVFDTRYFPGNAERTYDVSRDGQKFLMIKDGPRADDAQSSTTSAAAPAQPTMTVVLNWIEELKARLPPK
jgi:serine/threonine-protein kinase